MPCSALPPKPPFAARCGLALAVALGLLLAGCASRGPAPGGPSGPGAGRDGPHPETPAGLDRVPDAEPRIEPWRPGGPNKPYEVNGSRYVPLGFDAPLRETGLASWYGRRFHGRPTSTGEPYDMFAMSAAHKTMPLPSYARVRNPANGREIIVRVNDRGPFVDGRVIDLSYTAALRLGVLGGVAPVVVERITHEEIRAGTWRHDRTLPRPPVTPPFVTPPDDPLMALVAARSGAAAAGAEAPPTAATPAGGFWLQLGAFRAAEAAADLARQARRAAVDLAVTVLEERGAHRVQAGPFASRAEAEAAADRLRGRLALAPQVVERR